MVERENGRNHMLGLITRSEPSGATGSRILDNRIKPATKGFQKIDVYASKRWAARWRSG